MSTEGYKLDARLLFKGTGVPADDVWDRRRNIKKPWLKIRRVRNVRCQLRAGPGVGQRLAPKRVWHLVGECEAGDARFDVEGRKELSSIMQ
jgi:hypothetical protein